MSSVRKLRDEVVDRCEINHAAAVINAYRDFVAEGVYMDGIVVLKIIDYNSLPIRINEPVLSHTRKLVLAHLDVHIFFPG